MRGSGLTAIFCILLLSAAPQPAKPRNPSWWQRLLRFAGITVTPARQRGGAVSVAGDLWIRHLRTGFGQKIAGGFYRTPVFACDSKTLFALDGPRLVALPANGGDARVLATDERIGKLIGVDWQRCNEVLVLASKSRPAVLSLSTLRLRFIDVDPERDARYLAYLDNDERDYGETVLNSGLEGGHPVIVVRRGDTRTFIRCTDSCGQPALDRTGRMVAYVMSLR
jgi:hypothetical protein